MIDNNRMEQAIEHLLSTNKEYAAARVEVNTLNHDLKVLEAMRFLEAKGTVKDRESQSITGESYSNLKDLYYESLLKAKTIGNKRITEEKIIEVFIAIESNRRYLRE